MALERDFQPRVIQRLMDELPVALVGKVDATRQQGSPDLAVFFEDGRWALLEVKKSSKASRQPNQEYYVEKMNNYSYSAFIYPENEDQIFDELEQTFGTRGSPRFSKCQ